MLGTRKCVAMVMIAAGSTLSASVAAAQGGSIIDPISFGISGGVSVPTGDLANGDGRFTGVNTGYNVTGSLGVSLPVVPFSLRGDIAYDGFGTKNVSLAANNNPATGAFNADVRIIGFTANVVFPVHLPFPIVRPYLIGGGGVYNVRTSPTTGGSTSQSNFGFNIGAGVSVPFVLFNGFIEARYHDVSQNHADLSFVPITVGVMF
ncbi:MAG TPA: outer membrane beta-barrel protein [Gemmatimonadaceae bacterium]|nr:outer membrane beta-barrel protein [Gemmatimonadaceae bacterium]